MMKTKQQRYVVQAGQGDCYYFYKHTTDVLEIESNKDLAIRDCFIADFGRISGVIVQDQTDCKTIDGEDIYEGDIILLASNSSIPECIVLREGILFYAEYEDENLEKCLIPLDSLQQYKFPNPDSEFLEVFPSYENECGCCECCGCTCDE